MLSDGGSPSHYKSVSKRLKQIQGSIVEITILNRYLADNDYILNETRDLHNRWKTLSFNEKRIIIENSVKGIIIRDGELEINLLYSPSELSTRPPFLIDDKKGNHRMG